MRTLTTSGACRWAGNTILLISLLLTGCNVARPSASGSDAAPNVQPAAQSRPLIALFGKEPASVATRAFVQQGTSLGSTFRVFNALLTLSDAHGLPQPELLASLPILN